MAMRGEGNIRKLMSALDANGAVQYTWVSKDILDPQDGVEVNPVVGQDIRIEYQGKIHCTVSGKSIRKAYGDGMSFDAFQSSPLAVESIIRPELSRIHEGVALRDAAWEEAHHNQPHVVYLSYTGGVKVGVTRTTQIPYRWIDQGASGAILLAETPYRQLAGLIEVAMKEHFADKTQWRAMLTAGNPDAAVVEEALLAAKDDAFEQCPPAFEDFMSEDDTVHRIQFPSVSFPEKVASVTLDKAPLIEGKLMAIKGQYLLLDGGRVFNVRRHSGYRVRWDFG
ncbi:MAG TPA: DUF2797 domain-containing protein [Flavobacteriales bacterium]|jgi:hypothetical protein|nr:DUF2797 domain-containing protein [Flavobacteriales bacterium]